MKTLGLLLFFGLTLVMKASVVWPDAETAHTAEENKSTGKTIDLSLGVSISASFEITNKGNGTLDLPGLRIRVYDDHNDGVVYRDGLLKCEWRDEDGDGVLDLVVSGFAQFYGEKGNRVEIERPIQGLFRYITKEKRFVKVHCSPEIYFQQLR